MAADEEHIEGFVDPVGGKHGVGDLVEDYGHRRKRSEHRDASPQIWQGHAAAVVGHQHDAHDHLKAVMHHGLNVDTDHRDEYVTGIDHDRHPCKENEARDEHRKEIPHRAILHKDQEGECEQRGGAELIGERIPLEVECDHVAINVEGVHDLLVHLKDDHDSPHDGQHPPHGFVGGIAEKDHGTHAGGYGQDQAADMPQAVKGGSFHGQLQKFQNFYEYRHKLLHMYTRGRQRRHRSGFFAVIIPRIFSTIKRNKKHLIVLNV